MVKCRAVLAPPLQQKFYVPGPPKVNKKGPGYEATVTPVGDP